MKVQVHAVVQAEIHVPTDGSTQYGLMYEEHEQLQNALDCLSITQFQFNIMPRANDTICIIMFLCLSDREQAFCAKNARPHVHVQW